MQEIFSHWSPRCCLFFEIELNLYEITSCNSTCSFERHIIKNQSKKGTDTFNAHKCNHRYKSTDHPIYLAFQNLYKTRVEASCDYCTNIWYYSNPMAGFDVGRILLKTRLLQRCWYHREAPRVPYLHTMGTTVTCRFVTRPCGVWFTHYNSRLYKLGKYLNEWRILIKCRLVLFKQDEDLVLAIKGARV